jgi:hypothetical protein
MGRGLVSRRVLVVRPPPLPDFLLTSFPDRRGGCICSSLSLYDRSKVAGGAIYLSHQDLAQTTYTGTVRGLGAS